MTTMNLFGLFKVYEYHYLCLSYLVEPLVIYVNAGRLLMDKLIIR